MNGNEFKRARESLDLSQEELAELLCFSGKRVVSNIEVGFRKPGKLAATVLLLLSELPEKRSKELQALLRIASGHVIRSVKDST